MVIRALIGFVFLWSGSVGIAGEDAVGPVAKAPVAEPPPLRVVVSNAYLRYLVRRLPNKVGIEPNHTFELRKKLGLPDSLEEIEAAAPPVNDPAKSPLSGIFGGKIKKVLAETKSQCELVANLPQFTEQLAQTNKALTTAAEQCREHSGLNLCVEVESNMLASGDQSAAKLLTQETTILILSPDDWEKIPADEKSKLGSRRIPLKLPEIKSGKHRILGFDLGEIVIAWNDEALKTRFAENRVSMAERAVKWFDLGISLIPQEEKIQKAIEMGLPIERIPEAEAMTRELVQVMAEDILLEATSFLEEQVFCRDKTISPRERARNSLAGKNLSTPGQDGSSSNAASRH